ncbi:peptidoglycan-binding domain-containing protein [Nitrospirillum bahiense]|uniref:peptidoglycan-binding domain-containing protein n=1 Tax=Nitrospirillum amazonense TaxID=28077 RepID=UPI00119F24D5|nr:peptidoglycan-binding domain-containing protein [Nitrospirillum amazonense]
MPHQGPGYRPIEPYEVSRFGIDDKNHLYWDGDSLTAHVKLTTRQFILSIVAAFFTMTGVIASIFSLFISANNSRYSERSTIAAEASSRYAQLSYDLALKNSQKPVPEFSFVGSSNDDTRAIDSRANAIFSAIVTNSPGRAKNGNIMIQAALHDLGFYNGNVDGIIGPITLDAVRKYAASKKIRSDYGISSPIILLSISTDIALMH